MQKIYHLVDSKLKIHEYDFEVENKTKSDKTIYRLKRSEIKEQWTLPGELLLEVEDNGNGFKFIVFQEPNKYDTFTELSVLMNCIRTLDTGISNTYELMESNPAVAKNL